MFSKHRFYTLLTVALLGSSGLAQTPATGFDTAQLDRYVTELMEAYDVPGVGLAVVEDGEIRYVRGYGVRDVTTGAPVLPGTHFAVGSVTKSFTALGMMLLVEDGRVDLDAPVTTYLPEFRLADPKATRTVTVRHLLTHTTGLTRTDASTFDPSITATDIIQAAATTPLVGAPGEVFVYSNVNTIVAGAIIERVTGRSWEDFTRARVLKPLGMTETTLSIAELEGQADVALPHLLDVLDGLKTTDFLALGADAPAGALNASAAEMARYLRFQLGDGAPLLTRESLNEMHKGQIAAPDFNLPGVIAAQARAVAARPEAVSGPLVTDAEYGFYWGVERFLGERLVQHGGNTTGQTANVTLLPESRSGVVILANADSANTFMEVIRLHVARLLLDQEEPDVDATLQAQLEVLSQDNASRERDFEAARTYRPARGELSALAGAYESLADPGPTRVSVVGDRALRLESGLQSIRFAVELLPLGGGRFMSNSQPLVGVVVRFVEGDEGRTVEMETLLGAVPVATGR